MADGTIDMTLSEQVCSLELAKRLKELGVKQESLFAYIKTKLTKGIYYVTEAIKPLLSMPDTEWYSAFTVAELGEMLQKRFDPLDSSGRTSSVPVYGGMQYTWYQNGEVIARADTEADARAKMLIHLIEQGIIDPTKV